MEDAVFEVQGNRVVPTKWATGPWYANALHGGAPAAFFVREFERAESPVPMHLARITVDILRPVPREELRLETREKRAGRKVQLLEASLFHGETEVARAACLRIRTAEVPLPLHISPAVDLPRPRGDEPRYDFPQRGGFMEALDVRFVRGSYAKPGPATAWGTLGSHSSPAKRIPRWCTWPRSPTVETGLSALALSTELTYINADLNIVIDRTPRGEWFALDAATYPGEGHGTAESTVFDEWGRIGRALQCIYFDAPLERVPRVA